MTSYLDAGLLYYTVAGLPKLQVWLQQDTVSKSNHRVIYNRVPKCGSMIFVRVMEATTKKNDSHFFLLVDDKHLMGPVSAEKRVFSFFGIPSFSKRHIHRRKRTLIPENCLCQITVLCSYLAIFSG